MKRTSNLMISVLLLMGVVAAPAGAYLVTLSPYNQGFDINAFYNDGEFNVEAGIVNPGEDILLVIVGDPANVETILELPEESDPFQLASNGSDFHFEVFQPFRFPDRFDGLFSTTVDDPVFFVPDNGTVTSFYDDSVLADDRIDLSAHAPELPSVFYEVDFGDVITMIANNGTKLFIRNFQRLADFTIQFDISDVPEPGTFMLLGLGLMGIVGITRRKGKQMNIKKIFPFSILNVLIMMLTVTALMYSFPLTAQAQDPFAFFKEEPGKTRYANLIIAYNQQGYSDRLGSRDTSINGGVRLEVISQYGTPGTYRFFQNGSRIYRMLSDGRPGMAFLWGPISNKWKEKGHAQGILGYPTLRGRDVEEDIAPAQTETTGKVVRFEGGAIYTYKDKAFALYGNVYTTYRNEGETISCLGFPISDVKGDRADFEGGYIEAGQVHCETPELVSVEGPGCVKVEGSALSHYLTRSEFNLVFYPSRPEEEFVVTFFPDAFSMNAPIWDGIILDWDNFEKNLTRDVEFEVRAGKPPYGTEYGSAPAKLTLVNEDYNLITKIEIGDEFLVSKTAGNDFYQTGVEVGGKVDDLVDALKTIQKIVQNIRKGLNIFKDLPGADQACTITGAWVEHDNSKPKDSPLFGGLEVEESKSCCAYSTPNVLDKVKVTGELGMDLGKLDCDFPEWPIVSGVNVGLTAMLGIGASVEMEAETKCHGAYKFCFSPNFKVDAGLGVYLSLIHKSIARADLKGELNSKITWKDLCYDFLEGMSWGKVAICSRPKVIGSVTAFSIVTYKVEANIGGEQCASF